MLQRHTFAPSAASLLAPRRRHSQAHELEDLRKIAHFLLKVVRATRARQQQKAEEVHRIGQQPIQLVMPKEDDERYQQE